MDNCFTSRHNQSLQMPQKDVRYIVLAGSVTECALCHLALPSCLSFLLSHPVKTPSKLIAGTVGRALPVGY